MGIKIMAANRLSSATGKIIHTDLEDYIISPSKEVAEEIAKGKVRGIARLGNAPHGITPKKLSSLKDAAKEGKLWCVV